MKDLKKQENKKNEKELDFNLVHTGTTIVAPWLWNDAKEQKEQVAKKGE